MLFYSVLHSENKTYDSQMSPNHALYICHIFALKKCHILDIENLTSEKKNKNKNKKQKQKFRVSSF